MHCFQYGRPERKELEDYCESVYYYQRNNSPRQLLSPQPFISVSRTSKKLLERLSADEYPILFEGIHCCYYLREKRLLHKTKIVRAHNVEHDYYQRLALSEKKLFKKLFLRMESRKLERFEPILKNASYIAAISQNDTAYFTRKAYAATQHLSAFHPDEKVVSKTGKGNYVLYHGSLGVSENEQAALFLVNKVFNNINIPLIIAGNHASSTLKNAVKKYPHIQLVDKCTTEEIYEMIRNAHINILPTFQATGLKLKLLAALFNGRFCMVNSFMVTNTGLEKACILAETAKEMQEHVQQYMQKKFTEEELIQRRTILEKDFSNVEQAQKLIALLWPTL